MTLITNQNIQFKDAFWYEYMSARRANTKMSTKNIYKGICCYTHWYTNILGNPIRLAWILAPLSNILKEKEDIRDLVLWRIREILLQPLYDKNGKLNQKIVTSNVRIFKELCESHKFL